MDWSTDLGISWLATGVAINTATLGAAGDIDGMLVTAQDQRVVVLYVDDRLNTTYRKSRILRTEVQFAKPLPGM